MSLFRQGDFTAHSGARLNWKIECDALAEDDLWTLFAAACYELSRVGPPLIVDDVLTTGASMNEYRDLVPDAKCLVIFARGRCPDWVTPIFTLRAESPS